MSYGSVTVLGRAERRRRLSVEQKLAVVAEGSAPGANISEIARRHDLVPAQVFKWRRLAELGVIGISGASELPSFVAVEITKEAVPLPVPMLTGAPTEITASPRRQRRRKKSGLIEIELDGGRRMRVDRDVDAAALDRVLEVLTRRGLGRRSDGGASEALDRQDEA